MQKILLLILAILIFPVYSFAKKSLRNSEYKTINSTNVVVFAITELKVELQELIERANIDYDLNVKVRFIADLPIRNELCVPGWDAELEYTFNFCDSFLEKLNRKYPNDALEIVAFISFHEISHLLLSSAVSTDANIFFPFDELVMTTGLGHDEIMTILSHIDHENIDSMATKIFRKYEFKLKGVADFVAVMDKFLEVAVDQRTPRILRERSKVIRKSYSEGWENWSNYKRLWSPCSNFRNLDNSIYFVIKNKMPILDSIMGSGCSVFSTSVVNETVLRYIKRLNN